MAARLSVVVVVLGALAIPASSDAAKAPSPRKLVREAFSQMLDDTRSTPRRAVSLRQRRKLVRIAKRARKQARRRPCRAIKTLRRYEGGLKRVRDPQPKDKRVFSGGARGELQADVVRTTSALLQLPRSKRCGGGRPSKVTEAKSRVLASSERRLRLRVSLPTPTFATQNAGGREFQQMFMEGLGATGDVGDPEVPTFTRYFGVPTGANVALKVNGTQGYDLPGVNLFPHQRSAVDQAPQPFPDIGTFLNPPFRLDSKRYKSNARFPRRPANAAALGTFRDLRVGGVDFAGGQYRPRSDTLHVFTSIDVTVTFGGANKGSFGDSATFNSPWNARFAHNYGTLVDNGATIRDHLRPGPALPVCGEEMLVVTDPELQPAATTFAASRNGAGISTRVVLTGSGPGRAGVTPTEIQSFIRGELSPTRCLRRPSYVVLLGNTAHVPTFVIPCTPTSVFAACDVATDLPYSLDGDSDMFADVMLGRIPATDLTMANQVVNKITTYETTPPAPPGDDFYGHATVTGFFEPALQCVLNEGRSGTPNCDYTHPPVTGHWVDDLSNHQDQRGFTKTTDRIIRAMQADSYDVDRLWTTDESVIPEKYYDGTDIPTHLRRPAIPWNANTTDFLNAYNGGRFLILHRDHGWPDGWGLPTLTSEHIPLLTNGAKLPVVFGVDCASTTFDQPDHPSFVELQVERVGGGAVAGFGDTRNSPSLPNNHMARGFFDALFPNTEPDFGSPTPTRRLGDVLLSGKAFMAHMQGVDWQSENDTAFEHNLYNLMGDPSMQMWANPPRAWRPPDIEVHYLVASGHVDVKLPVGPGDPPPFGTIATLFQGDRAIGRAIVGADGTAEIVPDESVPPQDLSVALDQDGALPLKKAVTGSSSMSIKCPADGSPAGSQTISGNLAGPPAGSLVHVKFEGNNQSFTRDVTTGADGSWQDTESFGPGQQSITATYNGDASNSAASASCSFTAG
jgi:Peptidase family C25/Propeptide_C25